MSDTTDPVRPSSCADCDHGDPLVSLVREQLRSGREERQDQTRAFVSELQETRRAHSADLTGLRLDMRYYARAVLGVLVSMGTLALLILAGLAGLRVLYRGGPGSLDLSPADAEETHAEAAPLPVETPEAPSPLESLSLTPAAAAPPYDPMAGGFAP